MTLKGVLVTAVLIVVAIVVGFAVGGGVIVVTGILWPFNEPADDDTLRNRLPVALAYLAWGLTSLAIFVFGWRRSRRLR